jgi:hypothetical protein
MCINSQSTALSELEEKRREFDSLRRPRLSKVTLICFLAFSLVVSCSFYVEGKKATVSSLSGDQLNILAVCIKKDHPALLQGDLVVGNLRDVEYYTPWFVDAVRLFSRPDHDYYQGLNRFLFVTSLIYFWGWWLLYRRWASPVLAGLLALLTRGVLWPPGNELWGIGGIWTMLPRTLFVAALPWVLWLWFEGRNCSWKRYLSALLLGLVGNVHPISGACIIVAVVLAEAAWTFAETRRPGLAISRAVVYGAVAFLGLAPYIWTYLAKLGAYSSASRTEFDDALRMRVGPLFMEPGQYFVRFCRPQWLLTLGVPWLGLLLLSREQRVRNRSTLFALIAFAVGCLLVTFGCIYLESLLRLLGSQARFAFQLIRSGKYLLVPAFIVLCLVCSSLEHRLQRKSAWGNTIVASACIVFCLLTMVSRLPVFNGVPVLGDDVCRELWPKMLSAENSLTPEARIDAALGWIRSNTPIDAKFVGPGQVRVGGLRAVIHDFGGAGMLIEGNPDAFVQAARRETALREARTHGNQRTLELLAEWGADFWLTKDLVSSAQPVYSDGTWHVYRVPTRQDSTR